MKNMHAPVHFFALAPLVLVGLGGVRASQDDEQEAREEAFAKLLTGARLTGWFTDSNHPDGPPIHDSYAISKAEKGEDESWRITALIGESGLEVPLMIDVKWAGDTPVMTLDHFAVPQMGTFDARVLFHGASYAGVWSGAQHRGELAGRIERIADAKPEKK